MTDGMHEIIDRLVNLQLAFPTDPLGPELTPEIATRVETLLVKLCVR